MRYKTPRSTQAEVGVAAGVAPADEAAGAATPGESGSFLCNYTLRRKITQTKVRCLHRFPLHMLVG